MENLELKTSNLDPIRDDEDSSSDDDLPSTLEVIVEKQQDLEVSLLHHGITTIGISNFDSKQLISKVNRSHTFLTNLENSFIDQKGNL